MMPWSNHPRQGQHTSWCIQPTCHQGSRGNTFSHTYVTMQKYITPTYFPTLESSGPLHFSRNTNIFWPEKANCLTYVMTFSGAYNASLSVRNWMRGMKYHSTWFYLSSQSVRQIADTRPDWRRLGSKFIIVLVDYFTRYVELFPEQEEWTIMMSYRNLFLRPKRHQVIRYATWLGVKNTWSTLLIYVHSILILTT